LQSLTLWHQYVQQSRQHALTSLPLSFPPKTGPLFLETEGGCDGSETTFGRGYTEASA